MCRGYRDLRLLRYLIRRPQRSLPCLRHGCDPAGPDTSCRHTSAHRQVRRGACARRGGFGITYRGLHKALQHQVAIKELFPATLGAMRRGTRVTVPTTQQEDFYRERNCPARSADHRRIPVPEHRGRL